MTNRGFRNDLGRLVVLASLATSLAYAEQTQERVPQRESYTQNTSEKPLIYVVKDGREGWVLPIAYKVRKGEYIPQVLDLENKHVSCVKDKMGRYVIPEGCSEKPYAPGKTARNLGDNTVSGLTSALIGTLSRTIFF